MSGWWGGSWGRGWVPGQRGEHWGGLGAGAAPTYMETCSVWLKIGL